MKEANTCNTYTIIFTNENLENAFTSVPEFLDWFFVNKKELINKTIEFKNELDIDINEVENMYQFLMFYLKTKKTCDISLKKYNKELLNEQNNEDIVKAITEFVRMNSDGKFLRASLVALGYQSTGKNDDNYVPLSLALEVFQTSILIHDDIIDKATVRRSKETIPVSYNKMYEKNTKSAEKFKEKRNDFADSMGICIGDLGFYLAEQLIVKNYKKSSNLGDILDYYHNTAIKTCKGEMIDILLPFKEEYFETDPKLEEKIMEVYKLKTAWYSVIGPYCLGLILGGYSEDKVKQIENILLNIGIAFQIKDDLLGIYGDENHIGKSTNSDIEEFKQTILYAYTMQTKYKDELLKYYGKPNLTELEISKLKEIFKLSKALEYATTTMDELFMTSLKEIETCDLNKESKALLQGFTIYLKNRSK